MHGARRKLSEPRIAGKAWAVWLSSQRLTSAGDSLLFIPACVISRTFRQEGKAIRDTCKKSRILRAILRIETETSLGRGFNCASKNPRINDRRVGLHGYSHSSHAAIVAAKPMNKAGSVPAAEPVEPRAGTKRNADEQSTHRTQSRLSRDTGARLRIQ